MQHQGRFDGFAIDSYQLRFSGPLDIEEYDGSLISYGDDVLLLVRASVRQVVVQETATGDTRRINVAKPNDVAVVHEQTRQQELASEFGLDIPATLISTPVQEIDADTHPSPGSDHAAWEDVRASRQVAEPDGVEQVGNIYPNRDEALSSFLSESNG